ncbi:MAG TPA: hypothetical protein IAB66_11785 [Candidatus Caccousia avistercoris]|nr:hypothetical protein [Candidatus Caccousia avistercoris]
MENDRTILRRLAAKYRMYAEEEHNAQRARLHKAGNDLRMIRPVVLIDELPWHEMELEDELTLRCQDPFLRETEQFLRREIYKYEHLRADMVLRPFVPVQKVVHSTGIGIDVQEETLATEAGNHIVSHEYEDQLSTEEDLEKLHPARITYDEQETNRRFQLLGEMIGDLIPIRKTGLDHLTLHPWDDIARYRGVTPLLIDLAEEPEHSHHIIKKMVDIAMDTMDQYLALGLFDPQPWSLHCTPIFTDGLQDGGFDGEHLTYRNIWGRGTAQIFASVSKAMHEEFEIDYMKDTLGKCGLVYYGCCEPLDKKIDIVEKIPNLRKVSITPWADVQVGAEAIGKKYVLAAKPNPSAVAVPLLDKDALRKEIGNILDASRRNGCSVELVLKDISTCCHRPQNIFEWEQIVMDMVEHY